MEVSTPDLRGRLAVVPAIAGTLGVITCHILGAFLNWQLLAIVFASLNVPFLLLLLFIPETPVYLIGKNKVRIPFFACFGPSCTARHSFLKYGKQKCCTYFRNLF